MRSLLYSTFSSQSAATEPIFFCKGLVFFAVICYNYEKQNLNPLKERSLSMKPASLFQRTKLACYTAYFTMSSIFSLPPILFVTLHETYNISYTLLGTLVLTNFCTQLLIDLIFTLFSKHFNVRKIVRIMPLITSLGLFTYALIPMLLPDIAYAGLLVGTVIFSVSAAS